jgi:hypothetical protein
MAEAFQDTPVLRGEMKWRSVLSRGKRRTTVTFSTSPSDNGVTHIAIALSMSREKHALGADVGKKVIITSSSARGIIIGNRSQHHKLLGLSLVIGYLG